MSGFLLTYCLSVVRDICYDPPLNICTFFDLNRFSGGRTLVILNWHELQFNL